MVAETIFIPVHGENHFAFARIAQRYRFNVEPLRLALIVLPLLAVWAVGRELWFGVRAEQLGRRLSAEDGLPTEEVAVRPSGRAIRSEADAVFPVYRAAAEQNPDDWRAWYRLGLAYDASGDRRRAREAVRRAIRLERTERRS